jgi:hypothetical protein
MLNEDRRQANKVKYVLWRHPATERKFKAIPFQAYCRPREFQEVEASRFQDTRHINVVKVSVLRAGRLFPPWNISGTHFVTGCVDPRATVRPERLHQWNIQWHHREWIPRPSTPRHRVGHLKYRDQTCVQAISNALNESEIFSTPCDVWGQERNGKGYKRDII